MTYQEIVRQLAMALEPFTARNSSEETFTITVKSADVVKARAALREYREVADTLDALIQVGFDMVDLTTCLHSEDEWPAMKSVWTQCMEEQDRCRAMMVAESIRAHMDSATSVDLRMALAGAAARQEIDKAIAIVLEFNARGIELARRIPNRPEHTPVRLKR